MVVGHGYTGLYGLYTGYIWVIYGFYMGYIYGLYIGYIGYYWFYISVNIWGYRLVIGRLSSGDYPGCNWFGSG